MRTMMFLVAAILLLLLLMMRGDLFGLAQMRSTKDQLSERVVFLERERHFPPREFHLRGEGFPEGIRSDPNFMATPYLEFQYYDDANLNRMAGFQVVFVNPNFDDETLREQIVVVEVDGQSIEIPYEGSLIPLTKTRSPQFLGQTGDRLFFVAGADFSVRPLRLVALELTVPFTESHVRMYPVGEAEWQDRVIELEEFDLSNVDLDAVRYMFGRASLEFVLP